MKGQLNVYVICIERFPISIHLMVTLLHLSALLIVSGWGLFNH